MPSTRTTRWAKRANRSAGVTLPGVVLRVLALLALFFVGFCVWIEWRGTREELIHADAIVVLGAAQWNGRPSPVLRARLDRAIELYKQGYAPRLVFTGGSIPGDLNSEASVSRAYAIEQGVPPEAILTEEASRTTLENLKGTRSLLAPYEAHSILLVSDPFHMARGMYIAGRLGFSAHPAPTYTSPIGRQPLEEISYVIVEAAKLILYVVSGR